MGSDAAFPPPTGDWRVDVRALSWTIWRHWSPPKLDLPRLQSDGVATSPFALVNTIFERAGFDEALARDADRAIGRYLVSCLLVRLEASSQLGAVDMDALFAAGLETLLDSIEARLRDGAPCTRP